METSSIDTIQAGLRRFGIYDYVVFVASLAVCAFVGLFYAFKGKQKGDAATEYLMGGRQMAVFPVATSLIASFISGIFLLGTPTEIYSYGTEYWFFSISIVVMGLVSCFVYLPVFHQLQLSSAYEYLERRFDRKIRLFCSVLFTIYLICWLPIVIYVPALAFNQVTGVNIHIITPCVCLVCIFYTTIGGLKAVVWTDVIQTWLMVGAYLVVLVKGTIDVGGFSTVWERSWDGGRIEFPRLDTDPTLRHSLLIITLGGSIYWTQISTLSQHMIQRYLTLATLRQARSALWIFTFGILFLLSLVCYAGLLVYATYHDCDPLQTGLARSKDQMIPLLVMQVLGDYPGVPGLFVSGIFSAALSSLSTGLNSMAAVVLEDLIKPFRRTNLSDRTTNVVMRGVVVLFGLLCVGLVFLVERLGTVLQLTMSLSSLTNGAMFGIFTCGILIPWVNSTGVLWGGIVGLICNAFTIIGAQQAQAAGLIVFPTKPTSTANCGYQYNITIGAQHPSPQLDDYVFPLFRMSYIWYTPFGGLITILVALLVSYCTGLTDLSQLEPNCVYQPLRKYLRKNKKEEGRD